MSKFDKDAIIDLLFYIIERKRSVISARSHYKEGTKNYELYNGFVKEYEGAEEVVKEYFLRRSDFEVVYEIWRKK